MNDYEDNWNNSSNMKLNLNGAFTIQDVNLNQPHWFLNKRLKKILCLDILDVL